MFAFMKHNNIRVPADVAEGFTRQGTQYDDQKIDSFNIVLAIVTPKDLSISQDSHPLVHEVGHGCHQGYYPDLWRKHRPPRQKGPKVDQDTLAETIGNMVVLSHSVLSQSFKSCICQIIRKTWKPRLSQ